MATSIVLPGLPTIRRLPLLGVLLFTIGVAVPIVLGAWVLAQRDDLVALALEPRFLTAVTIVGCAIVLTRLLAIAEVAHAFRRTSGIAGRTVVATLIVLAMAVPVLLLSLLAIVVQFGSIYAITPTWALTGIGGAILPLGIALFGLFLWQYARKAAARGWLR